MLDARTGAVLRAVPVGVGAGGGPAAPTPAGRVVVVNAAPGSVSLLDVAVRTV